MTIDVLDPEIAGVAAGVSSNPRGEGEEAVPAGQAVGLDKE